MTEHSTTADYVVNHLTHALRYLETMPPEQYPQCGMEVYRLLGLMSHNLTLKGMAYRSTDEYKAEQVAERAKSAHKKKTKKSLETRVVEWAEENLQVGDFVKFLGTSTDGWRVVQGIEKTKFPEYAASRVYGRIIDMAPDYSTFMYKSGSSVNGMEKIAIVVRQGFEVFNRKTVYANKG